MIERDGRTTDHRYWSVPFARDPELSEWTAKEWEKGLLDVLTQAVERRMVADVPVGVLLSGGLDSSLLVALLAKAGAKDLTTFSIGFDSVDGVTGDEFGYSDLVAQTFGTKHHQLHVPSTDVVAGLEGAISAMSEPMTSHDCVAFYLLSQAVSKEITVVQCGQGADEVLAGYDWYPPLAEVDRADAVSAYKDVFVDRPHSAMSGILQSHWLSEDHSSLFLEDRFGRPGAETALDAALRNDTEVMLVDDPVKRVDNMTMAWGLEARVPFLDHDLVGICRGHPTGIEACQRGQGRSQGSVPRSRSRRGDRSAQGLLPSACG